MTTIQKSAVRCAIYTRKSSEEGLEQSFNSLDAQREACAAFISSQRHEGWRVIPTLYDDGGYSGGDMQRPALQQLMNDIAENKIDTIVVYKVDRLTRSLSDFAKIVETLDAHSVSFVSVTQQFNTTTSMGRLTLNILLSFAQFEREVTGERIRDKIAASKRKGMWMGGSIPLGYDVKDRKLLVNQAEAKVVNEIYRHYLELGSVSRLKEYLDRQGITSKKRIGPTGKQSGGVAFLRGALYLILQNRTYLGEVRHRNQCYPGEHQAIVPRELWERVQGHLKSDNGGKRNDVRMNSSSLLVGLLQDVAGNRFRPSHTVKNGRRYRYYFLETPDPKFGGQCKALRLPAYDVERQFSTRLQSFLQSPREVMEGLVLPDDNPVVTQLLIEGCKNLAAELSTASPAAVEDFVKNVVRRIIVHADKLDVVASRSALRAWITKDKSNGSFQIPVQRREVNVDDLLHLSAEVRLRRFGGEMRLVTEPDSPASQPIEPLAKAIARAYSWRTAVLAGESVERTVLAKRLGLNEQYLRRILGCAFLAPDIVEAILDGQFPAKLSVKRLCRLRLSLGWAEQRAQLGFPPRALRAI
jgi:DNA invertase Pin-like site-specific DNA recombinase